MVAYIDEFKDRFRVGPIRRVPAASLDCGLVTPRGYRMFRSRPVSRMAARHEAPACLWSNKRVRRHHQI